MIKITDWSLIYQGYNIYTAPELMVSRLSGNTMNHPKFGNTRIVSSHIVDVKGRIVHTASGSIYKLGKIDPDYRRWIKKNYGKWDWRNPIQMKEV